MNGAVWGPSGTWMSCTSLTKELRTEAFLSIRAGCTPPESYWGKAGGQAAWRSVLRDPRDALPSITAAEAPKHPLPKPASSRKFSAPAGPRTRHPWSHDPSSISISPSCTPTTRYLPRRHHRPKVARLGRNPTTNQVPPMRRDTSRQRSEHVGSPSIDLYHR